MKFWGLLFLAIVFTPQLHAFNEVANGQELRNRLGLSHERMDLSQVKIAILDNGFRGFAPGKGMLPASTKLITPALKLPESSSHGLGMAQIIWEASGKSEMGPEFFLLNTNGFTNFKGAVDFVIKNKIDIVLYSQVWTFGSEFDGKGLINAVVNQATAAGVIWINAAGNLGGQVFNGRDEEEVRLINKLDDNSFTLTLTWADFADSETICATTDLDLELYHEGGSLIRSSRLVQRGESPDPRNPEDSRSCYARESFQVQNLERGSFIARILSKGERRNFRLIISDNRPDSLAFPGASPGQEIMPPADNPSVFTVGEKTKFSSMGPTADGRVKPDILIENAQVAFTNGSVVAGSSNAAAMLTGAVAILKAQNKGLASNDLFAYAQKLRSKRIIPAGYVRVSSVPYYITRLVPQGGVVRQDPGTYRLVIFSKEAPGELPLLQRFYLQTANKSDIIACHESLSFCRVFPISQDFEIKPPWIEFKQFAYSSPEGAPALWIRPSEL